MSMAKSTTLKDSRDRILDAAARLFLAQGFEGTSMRQLASEAGVNLAATNYHFGSKEGLMQEVLRRHLDRLSEERLRTLDALERAAGGKPLKPSQVVEAFFGSLLHLADNDAEGGTTFLRLLGRTLTEPAGFIRAFLAEEHKDVIERYRQALFNALPDVPRVEIVWRFNFMLGAASYAIAGTDTLRLVTGWEVEESDGGERFERLMARLMAFLLGGLRAPLPEFPYPLPAKNRGPGQPEFDSRRGR
ncbi:MAG: TetR family transcriptional regulator [Betaproteobacteria bacterium HGW-Betaproteobacteria-11]|nr:MAG: TetR family transcriptional regulator [Betaproteobacteria bacterium HGW-Betaproteobacteria-11]